MKLHTQWDAVTGTFVTEPPTAAVLMTARSIPVTPGPISGWSTVWATETLILAKGAFMGVTYSSADTHDKYQITLPAGYNTMKTQTQRDQVIKAGARLAQILREIWPD